MIRDRMYALLETLNINKASIGVDVHLDSDKATTSGTKMVFTGKAKFVFPNLALRSKPYKLEIDTEHQKVLSVECEDETHAHLIRLAAKAQMRDLLTFK